MPGRFEVEYTFALANPELSACKVLLDLAQMYSRCADAPTLALIEAAANDVRNEMAESEG